MRNKTDDDTLHIYGFSFERKDRSLLKYGALHTKRGDGGAVVYIADHIKYKRRSDLESSEVESIWLEITLKKKKKIFSYKLVYRPPSSSVQWINEFPLPTEKAASIIDEIHCLGDFNINLLGEDTQTRGERGGSVVECRTPEREVRGSRPTAAVLCP